MGQHDGQDRPVVDAGHPQQQDRRQQGHRHQHRHDAEQAAERKAGTVLPAALTYGRQHADTDECDESDRSRDPKGVNRVGEWPAAESLGNGLDRHRERAEHQKRAGKHERAASDGRVTHRRPVEQAKQPGRRERRDRQDASIDAERAEAAVTEEGILKQQSDQNRKPCADAEHDAEQAVQEQVNRRVQRQRRADRGRDEKCRCHQSQPRNLLFAHAEQAGQCEERGAKEAGQ